MHDRRVLPAVACQFALACNLVTVYYMLTMREGLPGWFFPQILPVYAPLVYLINRLFLKKERSVLAVGVLNTVLGIAAGVGYFLSGSGQGIAYVSFAGFFLFWLTLRGAGAAHQGIPLQRTLLTLDASFLLLVAFICYSSALTLSPVWAIPSVAGLCAAIIAAVILRSSQSPGLKGWLAVAGAFVLLFLLLWVVIGIAAPAGQGLVAVWSMVAACIKAVKSLLVRGFLFLLSLLPTSDPEGEMGWTQFEDAILVEDTPVEEGNPIFGLILLVIFVVTAVAGVIWLLAQLRRMKLRPVAGAQVPPLPSRERISLFKGLLRLLGNGYAALKLRFRLWQGRNSPAGLYFLLVHRCRRAPWHKNEGETPRQFLLRLCEASGGDEALSSALKQLARDTDAALYSNRPTPDRLEYAPLIRRKLGTALRLHFFRQMMARLPFSKK